MVTPSLRISVLMTTLNAAPYVRDSIASLQRQTFEEFELIIVDGESTDGTMEIIGEIDDSRIRTVVRPGLRRSAQLNEGLSLCQGDVIVVQDADDVAKPERLAEVVRVFDMRPDIDILGSWAWLTRPDGTPYELLKRPAEHNQILRQLPAMKGISFATSAWRREVAGHGIFDPRLGSTHDVEWFLRLARKVTFANIPKPLINLRQTPRSLSRSRVSRKDPVLVEALQRIADDWRNDNSSPHIVEGEMLAGLAQYYHGSPKRAREWFLRALAGCPFDRMLWRYLLPSLLPEAVFLRIRDWHIFSSLGSFYRRTLMR